MTTYVLFTSEVNVLGIVVHEVPVGSGLHYMCNYTVMSIKVWMAAKVNSDTITLVYWWQAKQTEFEQQCSCQVSTIVE